MTNKVPLPFTHTSLHYVNTVPVLEKGQAKPVNTVECRKKCPGLVFGILAGISLNQSQSSVAMLSPGCSNDALQNSCVVIVEGDVNAN